MNAVIRPEAAWGALARTWDTWGAGWNWPVAQRLVELASLRAGMTVLDAGCGTGAAALAAARAVWPGGWVTGVDSAAAMVVRARRAARDAGIGNAVFLCENAAALPYGQAAYDAVIASMVVAHLPDPAGVLRSWRSLLRAGGVLAFSWTAAEDPAWRPALEAVGQFLLADQQCCGRVMRWAVADAEAMVPAGMGVWTVTETVTTWYESAEHWWASDWAQEPALAWAQIPRSQRGQAKHAAFAMLAGLAAGDGSLQRTRTVCYTTGRLPAPSRRRPALDDPELPGPPRHADQLRGTGTSVRPGTPQPGMAGPDNEHPAVGTIVVPQVAGGRDRRRLQQPPAHSTPPGVSPGQAGPLDEGG